MPGDSTSPGLHRLAGNTLWQVGGKWVQFVVVVGINIWMARYLGAELLGRFAYILSVVGVLMLISQVGADLYLRSEMVRDPPGEPGLIGSTLFLRVVAATVSYLGLLAYAVAFHRGEPELPLLALAGLGLASMILDVFRSYFVGHVRADVVAIADLKGFGAASAVKLTAIALGWPLYSFIGATLIEWMVPGLILTLAYLRTAGRSPLRRSALLAKRILRESAPLYVSAIAISLYLRVDQLMLNWIRGPEELGYFAASARLVEKLYLIPVALGASFLPTIIGQKTSAAKDRFLANMRRFFELNVAVAYGVVVVFLLGGTSAVVLALGPSFTPSAAILSLQVFALPFMALGVARGQYVVAEQYFRFALWTNTVGVAVNIVLNLVLIPAWGGRGAAIATLGTFVAVHVASSFATRDTRRWGVIQIQALLLPCFPRRCLRLAQDLRGVWRSSRATT